MKVNIRKFIGTIKEIYGTSFNYIKHLIVNRVLTKVVKIEPKQYSISISKLPEDERTKILAQLLTKEREEKVLLQQKIKQLEEQLEKTRQKALAKLLEEIAKEEKEKGKPSVSLYEVLQLAKRRGILPFRKPPMVYDLTMQRIGYLKDIILHPSGGFSFVIEVSKGNEITTPPFGSIWEAVFHAENISQQLPNTLILNVVKMEDGRLVKVPEAYVNALYKGEPAEKVIAYLKQQIDKLANEAMSSKLLAELLSVENTVQKIDNEISSRLASTALSLYENLQRTAANVLVPTTLAAVQSNTTLQMELAHQRSLAEHAKELADQYASRLKTLEESMAPEKIIIIQNEMLEKLKEISTHLADLMKEIKELKGEKTE